MFYERLAEVEKQIEALQKTMGHLKFKCWYYDNALADGTEKRVKNMAIEEMPQELREHKL